jgi:hypothetical protein
VSGFGEFWKGSIGPSSRPMAGAWLLRAFSRPGFGPFDVDPLS